MAKHLESKESDFLLYTTPRGEVKIHVLLENETIWLSQKDMADLFDCSVDNVSLHLKNIFKSDELNENQVVEDFSVTASDGKKYSVKHYNLDAIISVGYRVNSSRATQFRIWATQVLKEYIIKGFAMNDERLKQGEKTFGKDYYQELLERVRSIRASERRIYLQITDIFAECSTDYDPNSKTTKDFFAMMQNKFHYAISGQTAAEIIHTQASHSKRYMGLTTWKNSPDDRILISDVTIAKNYLSEKEIKRLERTVSGFFDYIENLIENRRTFTMKEFISSVDKFLAFNEYRILDNKGKISMKQAEEKALNEYKEFNRNQRIESDFDHEIKQFIKKNRE